MGKFTLLILLLVFLNAPVIAQTFDFTKSGDEASNDILKNCVSSEIEGFHGDVVSFFYDIDNDNKNEIIGIVKSRTFYTLEGYNLVVVEEDEGGWQMLPTNIYFDETQPLEIKDSKISYHKTVFRRDRKTSASVRNSHYKAAASIKGYYANKKMSEIDEALTVGEGHPSIEINVEDFPECEQKSFEISYPDGYEKPKYYIEMH